MGLRPGHGSPGRRDGRDSIPRVAWQAAVRGNGGSCEKRGVRLLRRSRGVLCALSCMGAADALRWSQEPGSRLLSGDSRPHRRRDRAGLRCPGAGQGKDGSRRAPAQGRSGEARRLYAATQSTVGTYVGIFVLVLVLSKLSGLGGWAKPVALAGCCTAVAYVLFGLILGVPLPLGILEGQG
jgi:hypothetical protein